MSYEPHKSHELACYSAIFHLFVVMNAFEQIAERLKKYPDLNASVEPFCITVKAQETNGFDVCVFLENGEYTVNFNGWHECFDESDVESVLNCFAFGLSDSCRIKEFSKNGEPYKWILQSKVENNWVNDSTTGLFFFNLFKRTKVRYLQNKVIRINDS